MKCVGLFLATAALAAGQTTSARSTGVQTEWDIRKTLDAIVAHAKRLQPILDQLDPKSWTAKGASEAYVTQWSSGRAQNQAIVAAAQELSQKPDALKKTIETYFRIQSLETLLGSLGEGIRRYHNPAVADLLSGVVSENGANRERLRQYVLDLAGEKEQEFQVVDREAQRCREAISKAPVSTHKSEKKP